MKEKKPLTHYKSSKYNDGQEIWNQTHESSEVREAEIPKLSAVMCGTDSGHDGGRRILEC